MCSVSPIELTASKPVSGDLPVVAEADLGQVGQALALDGGLAPRGLLARQRHAEHLDAVLPGGVPDHAAPAAADVEQPHARLEVELARDQVVLEGLRLLQAGVLGAGSTRTCRSSRARGPSRRSGWTRRSGGGSPRRRGCASAGSPRAAGASAAAPPAAAARAAAAGSSPMPRASWNASAGEGTRNRRLLCRSHHRVVRVARVHALELEVAGARRPGPCRGRRVRRAGRTGRAG